MIILLFRGIKDDSFFYFVHSYYAPVVHETVAMCNYINRFSAMVVKGNIAGVQFHPEKSQKMDFILKILENGSVDHTRN